MGARQVAEKVLRELGGGGRHRLGLGSEGGLAPHLLRHGEGLAEQAVEDLAEGAHALGGPHRLLHLPKDLRLAQDHGIEARGHAEGVPRGGLVGVAVEVRRDGYARLHRAREEPPLDGMRVVGAEIDLGAVAGRHQDRLGDPGLARQVGERLPLAIRREGELLADLQRSGAMVDAMDVTELSGPAGSEPYVGWFAVRSNKSFLIITRCGRISLQVKLKRRIMVLI